jgi:hypothetical protein
MKILPLFISSQLHRIRFLVGLMTFMLAITGCNSKVNNPNGTASTKTHLEVIETEPIILQTITPSPTRLSTRTLLPTFTPSVTKMITWTPIATLSNSQATTRMLEWFLGSSDCHLPCWAGIKPGKTTWMEAKQILGAAVNIQQLDENVTCTFGPCNHIAWHSREGLDIQGSITSNNENIINSIIIEGYQPINEYRLDKILKLYGPPEKVFLETEYHGIGEHNSFSLTLAYPDSQFIIKYIWNAVISGENVVGCIQDGLIYLSINPIMGAWTDDWIKSEVGGIFFHPLEEVTDLTISTFYEEFTNVTGNSCISSPGKYWP